MVISDLKKQIEQMLLDSGNEDFQFEAREIIREVMGRCYDDKSLTDTVYEKCMQMAQRRAKGEPLQYIFGHWEFYGYDFLVGEGVLIPRSETELLCEKAIAHLKKSSGGFADLCAGSGCIGITVARQTGEKCISVELSEKAFSFLERNIAHNNAERLITAVKGDIFDKSVIEKIKDDSLSAILSNPPYVNKRDMEKLQAEVRYEPETALFGGNDGLDYYRRIFIAYNKKLKKGGLFAVEIGEEQGRAVSLLMEEIGYKPVIIKDYSGLDRIVMAVK